MSAFVRRIGISLLVSALSSSSALAQSGGWKNTAEVYFMGASMSGTTAVGPVEGQIDASFSEIVENLQFGAMLNYRGEKEKLAISADVVFMALGASQDGDRLTPAVKVDADMWMGQLHGSWRTSQIFEVLAGFRYTSIANTVVLTPITGNAQTGEMTKGWLDPIVGARVKAPVGKGFSLEGYGDIGGFGVGCDLTWMLQARVNWQASQAVGLGLGYRALYQDYSTGSGTDYFEWKVTMQGPLAGVNVSF
jgi:hypothetical protein